MSDASMSMNGSSTLTSFISQYQTEELTSSAFFLQQTLKTSSGKTLIVNFQNLITKYLPELESLKTKITFSNLEYSNYRYNPKRLSFDIYGTTELWFLILEANELHSVNQFDLKTLYVYNSGIIDKVLRILNLEKASKEYNASSL